MTNLYNSDVSIYHSQDIYDSFNNFVFSKDTKIFNKLIARFHFYNMTKRLQGDIVECGVFKGSGLTVWLKLLEMHEPNSVKKVIGFDYFDSVFVKELENNIDKVTMEQVFDRCKIKPSELSIDAVTKILINAGFEKDRFDLVEGDISNTVKIFLENKPGFRISILYLDLDLEKPTYDTLHNMWDRVVDGGVVVFDEYAYHSWSESNAVDRFVKEHKLQLHATHIKAPTAYIIKE